MNEGNINGKKGGSGGVNSNNLKKLTLCSVLSALIIVMTFVPYTGYISYGLVIEITTLHIVVILGAVLLGWKYGAVLGGVWGSFCIVRALITGAWPDFINPMVSFVPRVIVGIVAGLVFYALCKMRVNKYASALITAIFGTLTNTVLVLSALRIFGTFFEEFIEGGLLQTILTTIIGINGVIELVAAVVIVPVIYAAIRRNIS